MNKPSLKQYLCIHFGAAASSEVFKNNNVNFYTSLGIISGKIVTEEDVEKNLSIEIYDKFTKKVEDNYCKEFDVSDGDFSENDGYMILKDVTIISPNTTYNVGSLVLFYDQIIGISLGNIER